MSFLDAEDDPPAACSVDIRRDCSSNGCIVSALANYTNRVLDVQLAQSERKDALQFLIHFMGDITQPLHNEAEDVGGNTIKVLWRGQPANLHACWDTQMVEKSAGGRYSSSILASYTATLLDGIDTGTLGDPNSWQACPEIAQIRQCALSWSRDANAINCQYVLLVDESGAELDGEYYNGAEPIIKTQLAKAGVRLGRLLNLLARSQPRARHGLES